jgi:rhodanese-related sulfurtransferase
VIEALDKAGALTVLGQDSIIRPDQDHPMNELLYPSRVRVAGRSEGVRQTQRNEPRGAPALNTKELAKRLRANTLFAHIATEQLAQLLEQGTERSVPAGTEIVDPGRGLADHLVILEGEVEASRTWTAADGAEKTYRWRIGVEQGGPGFGLLSASTSNIRVRALADTRYLAVSGEAVDELLGWSQLDDRMIIARHLKVFRNIPLERVRTAFERMVERDVEAGDVIVTQGELGDRYYMILSGEAEVSRTDPFTDEMSVVAVLGDGDAFGEEALVQNAYRNATVKMTTPGRLLVLSKADFDELLKPVMSQEVNAEAAKAMLDGGAAQLLDCRYDMEFEESRIPGARLVPLDRLRQGVSSIDPEGSYIVYCRSGRRSRAAAYLLKERGIKALSLTGGIKEWPYAVDSSPV